LKTESPDHSNVRPGWEPFIYKKNNITNNEKEVIQPKFKGRERKMRDFKVRI
jgi:hypothetical protein